MRGKHAKHAAEPLRYDQAFSGEAAVRKAKRRKWPIVLLVIVLVLVAAVIAGIVALRMTWISDSSLPDYRDSGAFNSSLPTIVYASDGETVIAKLQLENRQPVELSQVSNYVKQGTVAIEDERFYDHAGVDIVGIARAAINNITGGDREGASTITQQLVRNTVLLDEMNELSIKRKIREAYIALEMEKVFTKDEVLQMYLNTINYGDGCYGIQAAAKHYFSKDALDLTLAESALLVAIPQAPTANNPIYNPENALSRRNLVLDRMLTQGKISQAEHDAAKATPLELNVSEETDDGLLKYEYFSSYVRDELLKQLSYDDVFKGGLTVYSTIDVSVQEAAQAAVDKKQAAIGEPYEVALVALDPDNGFIRALIGGKDYSETQVNMATGSGGSGRQCGSSFKVFTLTAAIEAGISPDTTIDATARAVKMKGWNGADYVANYGNSDYGQTTIRNALAVSSNTAFARLCLALTPKVVCQTAYKMGITSKLDEVGAVTLGACSVTPLEMADAYATLANGGTHYDAQCIEKIVDRKGKTIIDNTNPQGERVLSAEVSAAAIDVMKGVITGGTGTAARLSNGQEAAGKTGTSENYMDSYFVGVTPQYSVAIWMGDRADYTVGKSIGPACADVFSSFLNPVLADQPLETFPTAAKPTYNTNYLNALYHIGDPSKWSNEEGSGYDVEAAEKKKKEEEEKKKAEEEAKKAANNAANNAKNAANNAKNSANNSTPSSGSTSSSTPAVRSVNTAA